MSAEENKALIRRFIEDGNDQLWKGSDWLPEVEQAYTPDTRRSTDVMPGLAPGAAGERQWVQILQTAFTGLRLMVEDLVAEGDQVVGRFTFRGTHTGDFAGIPATGKEVCWHQIYWYKIADGKIVEYWGEQDLLGLLQQLGVSTWEPKLPQ